MHNGLRPRPQQAAPRPQPRAPGASPGAAAAAAEGREYAKYRAHTNPSHTHTSPPKLYPPKAPFLTGGPRPVRPPAPERTPPGITLLQLRRQQDDRRVIRGGGGGAARRRGRVPATGARNGGRGATGGVPRDKRSRQAWAHAARSEGERASKAPRPAAAERDRARAADGTTSNKEQGKGKGTRRRCRGPCRAPRRAATERMELSGARLASIGAAKGMGTGTGRAQALAVRARAQVTVGRTHGVDRDTLAWGPGRDPRARARASWAPRDRQGGARELQGEGGAKEGGWGAGCPRSRTCCRCGASPPASNKCRRTTPTTTTTTTPTSTTKTSTPETSSPQNPPTPAPASPPRAKGGAGVDGRCPGGGGAGAEQAPQAQGPQAEPAWGAEWARPADRDWNAVPDPLGNQALPLAVEMYGWLSWACSGTTRWMRNWPFHAVLLRRDGGNREVPQGDGRAERTTRGSLGGDLGGVA